MSALLARLRALGAFEPAIVAWAVNGGAALLAAYAFHLTGTQEGAVATIVTALAAIYTAVRARPVAVPVVLGALSTAVTAAAAFGLHPSAEVMAVGTSIASVVLGLIFRSNVTPAAALRKPVPVPVTGAGRVHP